MRNIAVHTVNYYDRNEKGIMSEVIASPPQVNDYVKVSYICEYSSVHRNKHKIATIGGHVLRRSYILGEYNIILNCDKDEAECREVI